jgi:hypothetical protein
MPEKINSEDLQKILVNQRLRRILAYEDPLWFSLVYLRHYFEFPFATFHMEMFHIIRCPGYRFIVIMAFRGSGKSTIMNLANVLWSILGKPQKKFVVVISQAQEQAKNHFGNIKDELMHNELLRKDFGPFTDNETDWKKTSLELEYHGSRIMSVSLEQRVRGLKYGRHRPDLIICDDLEDSLSVQIEVNRQVTLRWFTTEIIPALDDGARIIVLGNLLHKDSLLMRLKKRIDEGVLPGIFKAYPLLDDFGKILWPEKFPTKEEIVRLRNNTLEESVWQEEYLLRIVERLGNGPIILMEEDKRLMIDDAINKIYGPREETGELENQLKKHTQVSLGKYRISAPLIIENYTKIMSEAGYRKFKEWLRGF